MFKKTALVLVFALVVTSICPAVSMARFSSSVGFRYHHHSVHGDEALFWGLTSLFLGTLFLSAAIQQPSTKVPMRYVEPKARVYSYPPPIPPGMCRWERYLLDNQGRLLQDQYGQPVREYTLGSCQHPPN